MVTGQDAFLEPTITGEESAAYKEYREAGGILGYNEWVDAGQPTATEERNAFALMGKLEKYLIDQMAQGFKEEAEADVIWNDAYDSLFGQGKYVGKRTTSLPSYIRGNVDSYITGLPAAEQRKIDQEARAAQEKTGAIVEQYLGLPLNAGGTPQQQIKAGNDAIRALKGQRNVAPDYLQSIIDDQINQLQAAISQITEVQRTKARARTEEELYPRGWTGTPEPGTFAQEFAREHGMSAKAAEQTGYRYFQDPQSGEFADLTSEEKSGLTWVGIEAAGPAPKPPPPIPITPPAGFEQVGETGSPAWKSWFARRYPSIVSQFEAQPAEQREYTGWMSFLEKERARIREEFAKQSPYARGERPGTYAPKIKTVAF